MRLSRLETTLGSVIRRAASVLLPSLLLASIAVFVSSAPAGADTATFTSQSVGSSGSTAPFNMAGPWTMAWSFNCSAYGSSGNFIVTINQPSGYSHYDIGPNELGTSGSGTDSYFDSGTFSLAVNSECQWTITVTPSGALPLSPPATFTSGQIGTSGSSPQFSVVGPWTMAWSYDCSAFGSSGNFGVSVNEPSGDNAFDQGPNELGISGTGTDHYSDSGVFNLDINSTACSWSITVSGSSAPTPTPTPAPTPTPTPAPPNSGQTGASIVGMAATPDGGGYWLTSAGGSVSPHGDAVSYGSMAGQVLNSPIAHIVSTPSGHGYWLVAGDGGTFAFGDAGFYGSMGGQHLNAPVVDLAPTQDGAGYWLVASDGGIFAFGDAVFRGSMGGTHLNKPVVGISADNATGGYWEVATDGGIFAFGAPFFGSTGALSLVKPVNGMAVTADNQGYWFVASDGGIFAFGDAGFHGSMGGQPLNAPVVGMAADSASGGYWLVGSDGAIYSFGAPFYGSD